MDTPQPITPQQAKTPTLADAHAFAEATRKINPVLAAHAWATNPECSVSANLFGGSRVSEAVLESFRKAGWEVVYAGSQYNESFYTFR